MADTVTTRASSIPWGRAVALLALWALVLIGLYDATSRAWRGEPPLIYLYPHGPSPQIVLLLLILATSIVFCLIDLYAIAAAITAKRPIERWQWMTGALFSFALALTVIPEDFLLAVTIRTSGPSKNARVDLHNAAAMGRARTVKAFLREGMPQKLGADSYTVLHVAAENGNVEIIDIALANGGDINGQDSRGRTPLHSAVEANKFGAVQRLLARGANRNIADSGGNTPEDVAKRRGRENIAHLLKQQ